MPIPYVSWPNQSCPPSSSTSPSIVAFFQFDREGLCEAFIWETVLQFPRGTNALMRRVLIDESLSFQTGKDMQHTGESHLSVSDSTVRLPKR